MAIHEAEYTEDGFSADECSQTEHICVRKQILTPLQELPSSSLSVTTTPTPSNQQCHYMDFEELRSDFCLIFSFLNESDIQQILQTSLSVLYFPDSSLLFSNHTVKMYLADLTSSFLYSITWCEYTKCILLMSIWVIYSRHYYKQCCYKPSSASVSMNTCA